MGRMETKGDVKEKGSETVVVRDPCWVWDNNGKLDSGFLIPLKFHLPPHVHEILSHCWHKYLVCFGSLSEICGTHASYFVLFVLIKD
jgi:hypothetical protein